MSIRDIAAEIERWDAQPHDGIADAYCLAAWGIVYEPMALANLESMEA
ncbi:MAG: hypothetical protein OT477_05855 [Chloroflexi bacterium]|nr:hypothetical protein [Chloroflexota bacterium]